MANQEHLTILKQGVEAWNQWREANLSMEPDLSEADLNSADLSRANLVSVNLESANLTGANLSYTNLIHANLTDASLSRANLTGANLYRTDLSHANLSNAILFGAHLFIADLTSADFRGTNLKNANLLRTQVLFTDFEGATLTGACIQDWHINADTNFDDVICDFVYLERDWEKKEFQERRPYTGTFAPGEFAKLVQQSINTIDLIFREGLDWKAFAYSFKQVEVLHEDAQLEVRSIENKGDGVVIVKVAAAPDVDKGHIYTDFTQLYEATTKAIAAQYEARLLDKDTQLREQSTYINRLLGLVDSSQEVQRIMAEQRSGDTNYYGDIKAVNFTPHGTAMGGVYNDFSNTQDLTQAATQIQSLLAQLQQQGQSPEAAQQQVANDLAEQAKQDPTLLGKLVMWGQKLGDATVTDVVKGVVKLALRSAGVPLP